MPTSFELRHAGVVTKRSLSYYSCLGPQHGGATVTVRDSAHGCTDPCPGHNKDTCEKQFCCGGPGAYTVYQIGGLFQRGTIMSEVSYSFLGPQSNTSYLDL